MTDWESDLFRPVWEGPYEEARDRLRWLEAAGIPVDLGEAASAGFARVEVAPGYVDEAKRVLARGPGAPRPLEMPLLDTSSPVFLRWRYLIALVILAGIVFAYVLN